MKGKPVDIILKYARINVKDSLTGLQIRLPNARKWRTITKATLEFEVNHQEYDVDVAEPVIRLVFGEDRWRTGYTLHQNEEAELRDERNPTL
jgi:hypothetical protein